MDTDKLYKLTIDDTDYETKLTKKFANKKSYQVKDPKKLLSIIPGTILEIYINKGDIVNIGQPLLVLEAMKMKNSVNSHLSGKIKDIHVKINEKVPKNHLLLEFE
jgi:biotin carboxyl carrier protein